MLQIYAFSVVFVFGNQFSDITDNGFIGKKLWLCNPETFD